MSDPDIDKAVRRIVGLATMRRLHRMIANEHDVEASAARWAKRLIWLFALAALLTVAWLAFR